MKPDQLDIAPSDQSSFRCVRVREQPLVTSWHAHPEYQLTLIVRGVGQRVVGDSIAPLVPGDLTLLGPHLPHCWEVDVSTKAVTKRRPQRQPVDAVVVQFRAEFLGREFWGVPETSGIVRLLRAAARGLSFPAATRDRVAAEIIRLPKRTGLQRLLALVSVLDTLAAGGGSAICSGGYRPPLDDTDRARLAAVIQLIHARLWTTSGPPGRAALAAAAGLAERSFSRFFHAHMGRTLPRFVNELRLGRARWLLTETAQPINAIARECGFRNLSHFNTQFRAAAGTTPVRFREKAAEAGGHWSPTPAAPGRSAPESSR